MPHKKKSPIAVNDEANSKASGTPLIVSEESRGGTSILKRDVLFPIEQCADATDDESPFATRCRNCGEAYTEHRRPIGSGAFRKLACPVVPKLKFAARTFEPKRTRS